jgi:hypothetical protein
VAAWKHDDLFPVIARVIRELCPERSDFATRDEIAQALLADPEGRGLVEGGSGSFGERATAWNMVDWFRARFAGSEWSTEFERERRAGISIESRKSREVWAYRPMK